MKYLLTITILSLLLSNVHARDPSWFKTRMAEIDLASSLPLDAEIKSLGGLVRIGRREMDEEQRQVYERAKDLLLSIPGHAEYYDKEIRSSMDEEMKGKGNSRDRSWAFETLAQLPSAETVKILGELLYDDRDPYKDIVFGDTGSPIPNSKQASMALTHLGIKKPAVKDNLSSRVGFEIADVETWKLWYEQVRDGTRSFSFEGDDTIYSLSGRVSVAKDGPITSRPNRKAISTETEVKDKGNSQGTGSRSILVAVVIFLLGIVALVVRQVRKRSLKNACIEQR